LIVGGAFLVIASSKGGSVIGPTSGLVGFLAAMLLVTLAVRKRFAKRATDELQNCLKADQQGAKP